MARLRDIYDALIAALAVFAGAAAFFIFLLILVDVSLRTAGIVVPAFGVTVVEYTLLYLALAAAPYLVRKRGHVAIDIVVNLLPERMRLWVGRATTALAILACLVIAAIAADLLVEAWRSSRLDVRGIDVPVWVGYLPMPIGFTLVAVELARTLFVAPPPRPRAAEPGEGF